MSELELRLPLVLIPTLGSRQMLHLLPQQCVRVLLQNEGMQQVALALANARRTPTPSPTMRMRRWRMPMVKEPAVGEVCIIFTWV